MVVCKEHIEDVPGRYGIMEVYSMLHSLWKLIKQRLAYLYTFFNLFCKLDLIFMFIQQDVEMSGDLNARIATMEIQIRNLREKNTSKFVF